MSIPVNRWIEAAIRETLEETAWTVRPTAVVNISFLRAPEERTSYLRICYAAEALHHDVNRALDVEIERALWLARSDLDAQRDRLRSPAVEACLDDYLAGCRWPLSLAREFLI